MNRVVMYCLFVVVALATATVGRSQSPTAEGPEKPLNVAFAQISSVDFDAGKCTVVYRREVTELVERIVVQTVKEPGKPPMVVETRMPVTVMRFTTEANDIPIADATLVTMTGKAVPFSELAKSTDLRGRDILLSLDGYKIDPYYLKYMSKDMLALYLPRPTKPLSTEE